jgi:hypothetical protein
VGQCRNSLLKERNIFRQEMSKQSPAIRELIVRGPGSYAYKEGHRVSVLGIPQVHDFKCGQEENESDNYKEVISHAGHPVFKYLSSVSKFSNCLSSSLLSALPPCISAVRLSVHSLFSDVGVCLWAGNLTNSMEHSPSCGANIRSAGQEILLLLWNSRVQCRVHKSLQLDSVLSQVNPDHNFFKKVQIMKILTFSFL